MRAAMMRATTRLVSSRAVGIGGLPQADQIRDHARAIRAHTITRLDYYLAQFEEAVRTRGGHVHWAATASDAVSIVADIARHYGAKMAVKSKSMVSEEIELNAALAAAGVEVLETDLGEFVVQIDGDHPSHIVAPIIHKSRRDIARLFQEKLQASDADVADVPQMTAFARRLLREGFLKADMGISGGNFGVAETGSLCICTNEGNGRLTTTLPRVHVALMGIERIVPTLADLGIMLQVLGRSATGQKLTVYSNIITGPRRQGAETEGDESDGPDHLHIVLVDNGRSRLLGYRPRGGAVLHPLRCLPECVSGLSGSGRTRVRQRLSGPCWRCPDSGAARPREVARSAARQQSLWRVPRNLSRADRHSAHAAHAA